MITMLRSGDWRGVAPSRSPGRPPRPHFTRRYGDHGLRSAGVTALFGQRPAPRRRAPTAYGGPGPLFRVSLQVHDRDALAERLVNHGIVTGYVHAPPLDDYAGAESTERSPEPSPDPSDARWSASPALPPARRRRARSSPPRALTTAPTEERAPRPALSARPPVLEPVLDPALEPALEPVLDPHRAPVADPDRSTRHP